MELTPDCPIYYTSKGPDCWFDTVSLGRFEAAEPSVTITIGGAVYTETLSETGIEPFTTTPMVKTIEINAECGAPIHGCSIMLSTTRRSTVYLVSGKEEPIELTFAIPMYAYMVQWQWAYSALRFWHWPWVGYIILIAALVPTLVLAGEKSVDIIPMGKEFVVTKWRWYPHPMLYLWVYALIVDILIPTVWAISMVEHFPGNGMWIGILAIRVLAMARVLYIIVANKDGIYPLVGRQPMRYASWEQGLRWIMMWWVTTAVGYGGYVLVPMLAAWYYTRTRIPVMEYS